MKKAVFVLTLIAACACAFPQTSCFGWTLGSLEIATDCLPPIVGFNSRLQVVAGIKIDLGAWLLVAAS